MRINREKYKLACARSCKSQKDVIAAGIPAGTLSRIFRCDIRPETAGRIAKALGVDVTEIIEN